MGFPETSPSWATQKPPCYLNAPVSEGSVVYPSSSPPKICMSQSAGFACRPCQGQSPEPLQAGLDKALQSCCHTVEFLLTSRAHWADWTGSSFPSSSAETPSATNSWMLSPSCLLEPKQDLATFPIGHNEQHFSHGVGPRTLWVRKASPHYFRATTCVLILPLPFHGSHSPCRRRRCPPAGWPLFLLHSAPASFLPRPLSTSLPSSKCPRM